MATFGDAHACGGQALGEELARARIAVLPAVAEKDLRQRGIAEGAEQLGFAVRTPQTEKRSEQHQLADGAAMAAGVGDRAHAAERDAEHAYLGVAALTQRLHDLRLETFGEIVVEIQICVRIDRGDIARAAPPAHPTDAAVLDEALPTRLPPP